MIIPHDFNDVLSRLPGAKQSGDYWTAPCPLPGHQTPAGHLTLKDAGDKALVTCQGGKHTYEDICHTLGFDSLTYNGNGAEAKIIATYDYTDSDGNLLYQVVRYDPKDFKQRHLDGNGIWVWNIRGIKSVLYRLPEVLKAVREGQTIYICEGEKDADNLAKLGLTTTTNSGGAEKWQTEYSELLKGALVIILPDRDAPGERHAVRIATSLYNKAKSIKIVDLPDRGSHHVKDVSDWLAAGGTVSELEHLAGEMLEYKPKENEGVSLVCIAEVEPETVSWLWFPYIPKGKLTLLEGDPGVGKSWVSLAIATAVSLGKGLTILESLIQQVKPALVIIDPLVAYLGAGVDIHRANETRAVMAKLADIAERYTVAILTVRHLTKGGTLKPIYRGLGSIDLAAACRSVLMAGCDPDNPQKRGLVQIKSNLAPMGKAIGYELRDAGFYWTGESDLTWQRILSAEETDGKSALDDAIDFLKDELAEGAVEATQIEKDTAAAGINPRTLRRARESMGVKVKRQGESGRKGGGRWLWELHEPLATQDYLVDQDDHIEESGQLNQISLENTPLLKTDGQVNPEAVLGMPIEKAIEIWRSEGAPVIHLGPGKNCSDLEKLLKNSNVKPEHLKAVRAWLEKILKRRGES